MRDEALLTYDLQASAHAAGLAAYFLSLARSNNLPNNGGFVNTPQGLKDYIVSQAWVRAQVNGQNPAGIFNGVTWAQANAACAWDPNAALNARADSCPAPSKTGTATASGQTTASSVGQQVASGILSVISGASAASASSAAASSAGQNAGSAIASILGGASTLLTTTSTSSASKTTTSSAANSTPTTPLTEQAQVCLSESDFPHHGGLNEAQQVNFAQRFCDGASDMSGYIYPPSSAGISGFQITVADDDNVNYSYLIQWIEGCVTTEPQVNVLWPDPDPAANGCILIMGGNYANCESLASPHLQDFRSMLTGAQGATGNNNNHGVGGNVQVGCVKYSYIGGLGSAPPCDKCRTVTLAPST